MTPIQNTTCNSLVMFVVSLVFIVLFVAGILFACAYTNEKPQYTIQANVCKILYNDGVHNYLICTEEPLEDFYTELKIINGRKKCK